MKRMHAVVTCTMSLAQRGVNTLKGDNRTVRKDENTVGAICHVTLLDKYLQPIGILHYFTSCESFCKIHSIMYRSLVAYCNVTV